jgi:hypothetical protein
MTPPFATAATTAAEVHPSGVPSPMTVVGSEVSTASAAAGIAPWPSGFPAVKGAAATAEAVRAGAVLWDGEGSAEGRAAVGDGEAGAEAFGAGAADSVCDAVFDCTDAHPVSAAPTRMQHTNTRETRTFRRGESTARYYGYRRPAPGEVRGRRRHGTFAPVDRHPRRAGRSSPVPRRLGLAPDRRLGRRALRREPSRPTGCAGRAARGPTSGASPAPRRRWRCGRCRPRRAVPRRSRIRASRGRPAA